MKTPPHNGEIEALVIEADVSNQRVRRFLEEYLNGRKDIGATEKVFRAFGAFEDRPEEKDSAAFGFNVILNRGPLLDHSNWAEMSAWSFAVAEERFLLSRLEATIQRSVAKTEQLNSENIKPTATRILSESSDICTRLTETGSTPGLVIIAASLEPDTLHQIESKMDIPPWEMGSELRSNWIIGQRDERIFLYLAHATIPRIYALDVALFGRLIQYRPAVELRVRDVDPAAAFQQGIPDHKDRVNLVLYQSYEFRLLDPQAVWATAVALNKSAPAAKRPA
jgi:hypothetical protein